MRTKSEVQNALGPWTQFLHILVPGCFHAVCKRPAELRTTLFKQLEGGNYKLI